MFEIKLQGFVAAAVFPTTVTIGCTRGGFCHAAVPLGQACWLRDAKWNLVVCIFPLPLSDLFMNQREILFRIAVPTLIFFYLIRTRTMAAPILS